MHTEAPQGCIHLLLRCTEKRLYTIEVSKTFLSLFSLILPPSSNFHLTMGFCAARQQQGLSFFFVFSVCALVLCMAPQGTTVHGAFTAADLLPLQVVVVQSSNVAAPESVFIEVAAVDGDLQTFAG